MPPPAPADPEAVAPCCGAWPGAGARRQFLDLAAAARRAVPDINLTTDIIAGFPGETEAEWGDTLALVREIGFGDIHAFPYSPRPGTRAVELPGRSRRRPARSAPGSFAAWPLDCGARPWGAWSGRRVEVLVEGRDPLVGWLNGRLGYSPGYHPVRLHGDAGLGLARTHSPGAPHRAGWGGGGSAGAARARCGTGLTPISPPLILSALPHRTPGSSG